MIEYDFERKFHDLKYFKVGIVSYSLKSLSTRENHHNFFVENHQFNVNLLSFEQTLKSCLFNPTYLHTTCTIF